MTVLTDSNKNVVSYSPLKYDQFAKVAVALSSEHLFVFF